MRPANVMQVVCATVVIFAAAAPSAGWGDFDYDAWGYVYSVDFQGPTAGSATPGGGLPDAFFGVPITEGDILVSGGSRPGLLVSAAAGGSGVAPGGLGISPGPQGFVELDALSAGRYMNWPIAFSVDEFAEATGPGYSWDLHAQGALGYQEAAADVYAGGAWPIPAAPTGSTGGSSFVADGDGYIPPGGYGGPLGLIEPIPPTSGVLPDAGDNLDALAVQLNLNYPVFFSLDAGFADPLEPSPPVNSGTAAANGFSGADVLVSTIGGTPSVYAPASALGLDLAGADTDDLDALILKDDGDMQFTPGAEPFSIGSDWILFSVRRGSAVIGQLDSRFNVPIEPGDILEPPLVPGQTPAIWIAAEPLGLATVRSGSPNQWGWGDELDALGLIPEPATIMLLGVGGLMLMRRKRKVN